MLTEPVEAVSGTVKELADKYETTPVMMIGFLDGINESIKNPNPIDSLEEDSQVTVDIDLEKLYYNMCSPQRLSGFIIFLSGKIFYRKKKEKSFTKLRKSQ